MNRPSSSDRGWQRLANGVHAVVWRARVPKGLLESSNSQPQELPLDPLNDLENWVAIKVVHERCLPPHDIQREVTVLRRISHRNIIELLKFERGGVEAPYALYMPLIPLSLVILLSSPLYTPKPYSGSYSPFARPVISLNNDINPFEIVTKSIIYQLLLAVAYLHSLDPPIAHRDLNPSNVLINHFGVVKLIDFGIAWDQPTSQGMAPRTLKANMLTRDWRETPDDMCSQVSTGPYRAPELLFSPPVYSATAIDCWSLGATIAQFFTALQLVPSSSPVSSLCIFPDENEVLPPFIIPPSLKANIDYRASWSKCTLFDGERGELGLAWSIFRLRGTPNDETWPSFNSLPDVEKVEFREAEARPLATLLPNLPLSNGSKHSLLTLIDKFLLYEPSARLSPAAALTDPYFHDELLLPSECIDETQPYQGTATWNNKTLAQWLEPALKRAGSRLVRIE